jgi:hypothetical protein
MRQELTLKFFERFAVELRILCVSLSQPSSSNVIRTSIERRLIPGDRNHFIAVQGSLEEGKTISREEVINAV